MDLLERTDGMHRPREADRPRLDLIARAASAMIPRIRLYASKCIAISLRTIAGLLVRSISIRISVFNDRRSNSACQRWRNNPHSSGL